MTRQFRVPTVLIACAVALSAATSLAAQQARDIIETALERYESRMASIQNYTVVQEVMGMTVTSYFERQMIDGHAVFVSADGQNSQAAVGADSYRAMTRMMESATYGGRSEIDGRTAHAIRIDDPESIGWDSQMAAGNDAEFEAEQLTLYVDADDYVILRFEFEGTANVQGQTRPVKAAATFEDYRTVDGLVYPFRTTFDMAGMMDAGMSPEQRAEAEKQLAEFDKQMANMPESQRKMMEGMMGEQLKQLRAMLEGGGMTIEVTEVKVNAGPPK